MVEKDKEKKDKAKTYMLMKAKPNKENDIWLALAIMKATGIYSTRTSENYSATIGDVNFIFGPYDIAVTITGTIEDTVKTVLRIREGLGKAQCLDDTLTLFSSELPITSGEMKSLIKSYGEDIEMKTDNKNFEDDEEINFTDIYNLFTSNKGQGKRVLQAFFKSC